MRGYIGNEVIWLKIYKPPNFGCPHDTRTKQPNVTQAKQKSEIIENLTCELLVNYTI